jgi:glycosyltransferase involved in cell wall biosynthesis
LGGRTDVSDILANSNIGILTSSSEGLPVVILEYGLSKLPVVTTDVGQCAQVVDNSGFIVPIGDREGFASAIEKFIQSQELREKCGLELQDRINNNFSANAAYKKLSEVFITTLKNNV